MLGKVGVWRPVLAFFLALGLSSGAFVLHAQSIAESDVYIECYDQERTALLSRGSGVIVHNDGRVLTAKHVVPDKARCFAALGGGRIPTLALVRSRVHPQYDAMLLRLTTDSEKILPLRYRNARSQESIIARGVPHNSEGLSFERRFGVVNNATPDSNGFLNTTAMSGRGMSGGAVVGAQDGRLIGIIAGAEFDVKTGSVTAYKVLSAAEIAPVLGLEPINSFRVLSVDHDHGEVGKYFHFDREDVDFILGRDDWNEQVFRVRQLRTNRTSNALLARARSGGNIGSAHGRWDPPSSAARGQWQKGDEVIIER